MAENQYKDAITYTQPIMKEITDEATIKLFEDTNLTSVIKFLRTHKVPMTVVDLENAFKNVGEKKSDKTIYRYLKKLEDAGLVIQAGKRVFPSDEKKLKTHTLYMRTAKVFHLAKPEEKEVCPEERKMIEAVGIAMAIHKKTSLKSVNCLEKFLKKFKSRYNSYPKAIIPNAEDEISELLEDLDFEYSKSMIETISFLALLDDKTDWQQELNECFD
ncbi:MAG: hypothetical protein ACFE98_14890 [Candidatus Hermodarchaeota archaeon]